METQAAVQEATSVSTSQDALFEQWTTEYLAEVYATHPVMATSMGVHEYDHLMEDFNRFALREERDRTRAYLHRIDRLSVVELSRENRLDYRMARSEAQVTLAALEQQRWPERQPSVYLETIFSGLLPLVHRHFAPPEQRAFGLLRRLEAIPQALCEAASNLRQPPRLFTEVAIESAAAGDALFEETIPAFLEMLETHQAPPKLLAELRLANAKARCALHTFQELLQEKVLPTGGEDVAVGREMFEYYLRVAHFLDREGLDCEGLLAFGQEAVATIQREMVTLAEQIAPGQSWTTVVATLMQQHPTSEQLVGVYREAMEQARAFVEERGLVTLPPNQTLQVIETPAFARGLFPRVAYLQAAPFEPNQEGAFLVTPIDPALPAEQQEALLRAHSYFSIPVLAVHEGYPGHHLQLTWAAHTPSRFRRHFAQSGLLVEGWALYCEEMMWEEGFYTDPRIRLMQLKAALWRACRVLLDVWLHTRQRTPQQMVQFLMETAKLEETHAWSEVQRCALNPTLPMSYLVGKQAILQLREEMERRRGARFDLRQFHDMLLSHGSLPPYLLRDALFAP